MRTSCAADRPTQQVPTFPRPPSHCWVQHFLSQAIGEQSLTLDARMCSFGLRLRAAGELCLASAANAGALRAGRCHMAGGTSAWASFCIVHH